MRTRSRHFVTQDNPHQSLMGWPNVPRSQTSMLRRHDLKSAVFQTTASSAPPPQLSDTCTVHSSIPHFGHPGSSPTSATSRGACFTSGLNVEKALPWKQGLKCPSSHSPEVWCHLHLAVTLLSILRQLAQVLGVLKAIIQQGDKADVCHTHFRFASH